VIAIGSRSNPIAAFSLAGAQTVTIRPGRFVAVPIAVSVTGAASGSRLPTPSTYAVCPSGLIAICAGPGPARPGRPAVPPAARTGVTVPSAAVAT
jgi:hypothetical protein